MRFGTRGPSFPIMSLTTKQPRLLLLVLKQPTNGVTTAEYYSQNQDGHANVFVESIAEWEIFRVYVHLLDWGSRDTLVDFGGYQGAVFKESRRSIYTYAAFVSIWLEW
jgi:hypothetical protein